MHRNHLHGALAVTACALLAASCAERPDPFEPERAFPMPAFLVTGPSVTVSGTSGLGNDPDASSQHVLRYVGNPAPSGYSHEYHWESPRIVTESPETVPIVMEGTLDVSDHVLGHVAMIGLVDLAALEAGDQAFQSGAYMYIFRLTDGRDADSDPDGWRIGVTDGNAGGEIVQNFVDIPNAEMPADGILNVTFTVDGTADPTTCAVPATMDAVGCLTLDLSGPANGPYTIVDSYGFVVSTNSASPEFSSGAVPGWDDFTGSMVHYDLTIGPVRDVAGPVVTNVVATPNPASVSQDVTLTANVDDSGSGGSDIESAEYSIAGGPWLMMSASDGAFDEPSEDVTAMFAHGLEPGIHDLCVRGTDVEANVSAAACTQLVVYDPSGGFVTGGGWIDSPAGAYVVDPTLTGKAHFGFVSRYKKGASVPDGNTHFSFKAGGLAFDASQYDWLIVNRGGSNAQFKGIGTIAGRPGEFRFMLWASDDGSGDTFRIKIWDADDDTDIVYDNGTDQVIGGGNIIVHAR